MNQKTNAVNYQVQVYIKRGYEAKYEWIVQLETSIRHEAVAAIEKIRVAGIQARLIAVAEMFPLSVFDDDYYFATYVRDSENNRTE